jgi:hypothetical protein
MNGQLLSIRNRNATGTHAATRSAAQMEFAASQKRQEVTKADENETDESLRNRLCTALGERPLKYRVTLIIVLLLSEAAPRTGEM